MALDGAPQSLGVKLDNGTRVTHGSGANVKVPLEGFPVTMHELYTGNDDGAKLSFEGQFGFIEFHPDCRLPRHIHMIRDETTGKLEMLPERILVLNGVGVTELCGEYFVVAPGSLVDIPPGVPHTWNACPPGVKLPDGTVSDGHFTMVYNYSDKTSFFATEQTELLGSADEYVAYQGDLQDIRFPILNKEEIVARAQFVWNSDLRQDLDLA
ncbi:cupin domain-containing protein [Mesorhizobium sp. 1B3]|uniref:cupin domain-containing protein n=1 Tax=Mesorhizobium sp. 1B3 TaxID=3243599 RepID=UPI003D97048A